MYRHLWLDSCSKSVSDYSGVPHLDIFTALAPVIRHNNIVAGDRKDATIEAGEVWEFTSL